MAYGDKGDVIKGVFKKLKEVRKKALGSSPDELRDWFEDLGQDFSNVARRVPASLGYLMQGDLIMFQYLGGEYGKRLPHLFRIALVVINDTGSISYVSLQKNLLLTCFNMDYSPDIVKVLLQKFYKNRKKSFYRGIKPLMIRLFGSREYRSFILNKMINVYKINLDMESING